MTPQIKTANEKKLIGIRMTMSFADYKVAALWKQFIPRRNEIINNINNDLISLVQYKPDHFTDFKPTNNFERWAAVEVSSFDPLPHGMEKLIVPGGLYAVFDYKGLNTDNSIFQYIYEKWLPSSTFSPDDRPHYELLGEKYKNNDPSSEEEIWIPVKRK